MARGVITLNRARDACTLAAIAYQRVFPQLITGFSLIMPPFKVPTFQERTALAAQAKLAALEKLRAKPPVDEAVLAERRQAALIREAAQKKAREEKLAAREAEKALKLERIALANIKEPELSEEEKKRIRDEKYAARKNRAGKR
jgi:Family of unknown function (DUF6481)